MALRTRLSLIAVLAAIAVAPASAQAEQSSNATTCLAGCSARPPQTVQKLDQFVSAGPRARTGETPLRGVVCGSDGSGCTAWPVVAPPRHRDTVFVGAVFFW
jgi:hypothetical protein